MVAVLAVVAAVLLVLVVIFVAGVPVNADGNNCCPAGACRADDGEDGRTPPDTPLVFAMSDGASRCEGRGDDICSVPCFRSDSFGDLANCGDDDSDDLRMDLLLLLLVDAEGGKSVGGGGYGALGIALPIRFGDTALGVRLLPVPSFGVAIVGCRPPPRPPPPRSIEILCLFVSFCVGVFHRGGMLMDERSLQTNRQTKAQLIQPEAMIGTDTIRFDSFCDTPPRTLTDKSINGKTNKKIRSRPTVDRANLTTTRHRRQPTAKVMDATLTTKNRLAGNNDDDENDDEMGDSSGLIVHDRCRSAVVAIARCTVVCSSETNAGTLKHRTTTLYGVQTENGFVLGSTATGCVREAGATNKRRRWS